MTTQSTKAIVQHPSGPYFYRRGTDGCDETWDIYAPSKIRPLISIGFWDEADRSEALARIFTAAPQLLEALAALLAAKPDGDQELYKAAVAKAGDLIAAVRGEPAVASSSLRRYSRGELTKTERVCRVDRVLASYSNDDRKTNLVDFLADAMHWCQSENRDFSDILDTALMHYDYELDENEGVEP